MNGAACHGGKRHPEALLVRGRCARTNAFRRVAHDREEKVCHVAAAQAAVAADMRAENERLERILAVLPERHAMRGSTAFTVAELEDRLALVDDRLSRIALEPNAPERAERLWRERVGVMNSLVQVRYADAVGTY